MFEKINERLRLECPHLREHVHPLRTILETAGDFEKPLFFALCSVMNERVPVDIATELSGLLHLDGLHGRVFRYRLPGATGRLTFDTILYCALRAGSPEARDLLRNIGRGWNLGPDTSMEELTRCVEIVQDLFYPVAKGLTGLQVWNPTRERWERIEEPGNLRGFWRSRFDQVCGVICRFEGFRRLPQEIRSRFLRERAWREPLVEARMKDRSIPTIGTGRPDDLATFREVFGRNVPEYHLFDGDSNPFETKTSVGFDRG